MHRQTHTWTHTHKHPDTNAPMLGRSQALSGSIVRRHKPVGGLEGGSSSSEPQRACRNQANPVPRPTNHRVNEFTHNLRVPPTQQFLTKRKRILAETPSPHIQRKIPDREMTCPGSPSQSSQAIQSWGTWPWPSNSRDGRGIWEGCGHGIFSLTPRLVSHGEAPVPVSPRPIHCTLKPCPAHLCLLNGKQPSSSIPIRLDSFYFSLGKSIQGREGCHIVMEILVHS